MPDGLNFDKSGAPAVDTSTPESAAKALSDVAEYARKAHAAGENMDAAFEKVSADLTRAQKQLNELATSRAPVSAEDMSVKSFVVSKDFRADGKGTVAAGSLLLKGVVDDRTKQYRPGLLDQSSSVGGDWAKDLRKAIGDLNIVTVAKGSARKAPIACARVADLLDQAPASIKSTEAIQRLKSFVDNPGSGGEWIIDLGISDLIQNNPLIRSPLADAIRVHQMQAKTETIPAMTTGLRPYKTGTVVVDDPAAYTSSSLVTEDRQRTVGGMAVLSKMDRDAAEDAILNVADVLRMEISLAIRDGREDAIINGDTAGTQDALASWNIASRWGTAGLGGSSDHRRSFDGFRKYSLNNTVGGVASAADIGSAQTFDGIIAQLAKLTGTGGNIANTGMVVNKSTLFKTFMLFDEFKQAYILGRAGTADRAELANFAGYRLFLSDFMDNQLNATGVFDNVTKTKTAIQVVNFDRWEMNQRLGTVVEMDTDITRNQNLMVARVRESLWSMEAYSATASNLDALYLYNVTA